MKKYIIVNLTSKEYICSINDISFLSHPTTADILYQTKDPLSALKFDSEEEALEYVNERKKFLFTGAWQNNFFFDIKHIYEIENPLEY